MNVIGSTFLVIAIIILLYFGMGVSQTLMDDADANVGNDTALSDSLNTTKDLTVPAFTIMSMSVWILILIMVISVLYLLMRLA